MAHGDVWRDIDGLRAWVVGGGYFLSLSSLSQGLHSDGADSLPTYLPTYPSKVKCVCGVAKTIREASCSAVPHTCLQMSL